MRCCLIPRAVCCSCVDQWRPGVRGCCPRQGQLEELFRFSSTSCSRAGCCGILERGLASGPSTPPWVAFALMVGQNEQDLPRLCGVHDCAGAAGGSKGRSHADRDPVRKAGRVAGSWRRLCTCQDFRARRYGGRVNAQIEALLVPYCACLACGYSTLQWCRVVLQLIVAYITLPQVGLVFIRIQ